MKGAIFDMDGTLLDSMGIWDQTIPRFLEQQGVKEWENINEEIAALTLEEGARYMVRRFSLGLSVGDVVDGIKDLMLKAYLQDVEIKPGVIPYLTKLQSQGIPMCIATATPRSLALPALKKQGLFDFFSFVLTVDEVGAGKEKPDIFLECAKRLALSPQECCVYEDSLHGIKTALSVGFEICGVEDEGSAAVDQGEIKRLSHRYITNFGQLL